MSSIPQAFIDELLAKVDIVEIIEVWVTLQKAGRDYKACCPFHQEKTPSFTVSPSKQFYYCFGCGATGNAIKFLMEHQHLGFVEAIEQLAARLGMVVPTTGNFNASSSQSNERAEWYTLMEKVAKFYSQQLKGHPQRKIAIDYLQGRGLTGEICKQYGVGLAAPGWDNLYKAFPGQEKILVATGMLTKKAQYQDRFRNRIMFPIRDRQGRVIAFGGRVLDDATPKYLNSPETAIFHKSQELYGLFEATRTPGKLDKLIVVEGYLDVISLAQFGIKNAVATLGTALNVQHLRRLFRLVNQVIFCFDGDAAGQRAAWRALEQCLPIATDEREIQFLILPGKEDPDSYVRSKGAAAFLDAAERAHSLTSFMLQQLLPQVDLSHLDGKAKLIKLIQPLIQELPDGARKTLLWEQLTVITGLGIQQIKKICAAPENKNVEVKKKTPIKLGNSLTPMQRLISLLIQFPDLFHKIPTEREHSWGTDRDALLLQELLEVLAKNPQAHAGMFLEHWENSEYKDYLAALAVWDHLLNAEQAAEEVSGILARFKQQETEQALQQLHEKVLQLGLNGLSEEEKHQLRMLTNSAPVSQERD